MTCEVELLAGDCVDRMREFADASIDAVVCDPPYLLAFMGKDFDSQDGAHADPKRMQEWHERWAAEAFRVLRPGGHLLAFGGTRTYHRLAAGIEDAGFEIRDTLAWMYGSGFPKSLDVSKAIDKAAGAEREVVGQSQTFRPGSHGTDFNGAGSFRDRRLSADVTAPTTEDAVTWDGWGTALKPAFEPVVVARKPLVGTVAANVLAHGTGAINVDACRVGFANPEDEAGAFPGGATTSHGSGSLAGPGDAQKTRRDAFQAVRSAVGRWPANVLLGHSDDCVLVGTREVDADGHWPAARPAGSDLAGASGHSGQDGLKEAYAAGETQEVWDCVEDCPVRMLDEQTGELRSGDPGVIRGGVNTSAAFGAETRPPGTLLVGYGDAGGASRFFYCAKTSRAERSAGLNDDFEERMLRWSSGDESPGTFQSEGTERSARNHHPTVKPIEMMRWLIRLVTPPGGTVLDPFLGSGSTGCAAVLEPTVARFVGIEQEADYLDIARARIAFWQEHGDATLDVVRVRGQSEERRREIADAGQLDLLHDLAPDS